jgi:hypothetical protein
MHDVAVTATTRVVTLTFSGYCKYEKNPASYSLTRL